ncbi:hypothetical protein BJ165DRAFT_1409895 [Panaeolus papilionaceus]|nr:hypothetical protein BJ165DRAFT_1409895 [Panaeolus papilionaceus]
MLNSSFYAPSSRSGSPVPSSPPNPSQSMVLESYTTDDECHCKNQLAHWDMDGNIHPDLQPGCRRALELEGHLNDSVGTSSTSVVATMGSTSDGSTTNMCTLSANNNGETSTRSLDIDNNNSKTISTMNQDADSTELPNAETATSGGLKGKQKATEGAEEMMKRKREADSDDDDKKSVVVPAYKKEKVSLKI